MSSEEDLEGRVYSDTGPAAWVYMWVLQHIQGADFQVYASLRSFCDSHGKCFPTSKTIAERANVSIHTARKAIQKMRRLGIVHTTEIYRPSDGSLAGFNYFLPSLPVTGGSSHEVTGVVPAGDGGSTPIPRKNYTKELHQRTKETLPRASRSPVAPTALPDLFDEFWKVYPAKKGKIAARKAWVKACKHAAADVIIAGAMVYRTDARVLSGYIKDPATWLNGGHWDDETTNTPEKVGTSRPALPASNAPQIIPVGEKCPEHVGFRVGACSPCNSERKARKAA